ncbi:MAG: DNA primase [Desulfonatronovibrio sp.]
MGIIDSRNIAEIKSRLSLVDIVSRFVELKPVGDRWNAPCPFHQETKPSFTVSPDKGFYYCFGCQASGDVIEFYKNINGLDFAEAVRQLAREAGVEIEENISARDSKEKNQTTISQEVNSLSGKFFLDFLWSGKDQTPGKYLSSRKISEPMIKEFRLGWSPAGWQNLTGFLEKQGFTPEDGVLAGVLSRNQSGRIYDRFRSRLIFPIISLSGMVVAFGARVIDDSEPKYLNSSESPIYKKGDHLYGLFQARKHITQTKKVFLTEGYLDVIALHQHGYPNSCGILGTALTRAQVTRLAGLCKEVILLFDGDRAGQNAAFRSAQMLLDAGLNCRVLTFPQGEDAHSLLTTSGKQVFEDLLKQAVPGLDYCLNIVGTEQSPREIMSWVNKFLGSLTDFSLKTYYIPKVAARLGLTEVELRKNLERNSGPPAGKGDGFFKKQPKGPEQRDREILTFASCFPEFRPQLEQKNISLVLSTDWGRKFWEKIKDKTGENEDLNLDVHELDFYVQSRLQKGLLNKNKDQVFRELENFIGHATLNMTKQNLKQALIRAQKHNDFPEIKRILGLMQNTF